MVKVYLVRKIRLIVFKQSEYIQEEKLHKVPLIVVTVRPQSHNTVYAMVLTTAWMPIKQLMRPPGMQMTQEEVNFKIILVLEEQQKIKNILHYNQRNI